MSTPRSNRAPHFALPANLRRLRGSRGSKAALTLALVLALSAAAPTWAAVKGQYIAKFYTEALGRIPDQGGWLNAVNTFASQGCNATTLRSFGIGIYTSPEFNGRGYDNAAKLLTLYRGALNREPQATEFNNNLTLLNTGTSWPTMVNSFFHGSEFTNKVSQMCNSVNYGFGSPFYPIQPPVAGSGFQGNQAQLEAAIAATPPGGTVWLAQKAVIYLYQPLILKAGVTLATTGNPDAKHYANQARLVRSLNFNDAMVRMLPGSKLRSVWLDGQRNNLGFSFASVNIEMWGGTGTTVSDCRIGNPAGGTNLKALGTGEGRTCGSNTISGNLIDAYTSSHYNAKWADGITNACENATITDNEVVDASDVPIVVFGAPPATQQSVVENNRILNVGNSGYGGLVFDAWQGRGVTVDFTGAKIRNNTFWSGPSVHYDIGLGVGTRPWFGNNSDIGTGAQMTNNTSGISKVNLDTAIAVSGMLNATVTGNSLDVTTVNSSSCPTLLIGAALSAGWASGTIQGPVVDTDISQCVSH